MALRPSSRFINEATAIDSAAINPINKRRALGDITNAANNDDAQRNDGAKKPLHSGFSSNAMQLNVPSFPQSTMDIVNDISTVGERSYMLRPSDDIDTRDAGNPLLATSYVNELYDYFGSMEKKFAVNSNYMASQPYINDRMRCILVDWLVSIVFNGIIYIIVNIY